MKKKSEKIIDIGYFEFPDMGIGYFDGEKAAVKRALPGQRVKALLSKKRRKLTGRVLEVLEKSPMEAMAQCENASICGGCTFQTLKYDDELNIKKDMIKRLLYENGIEFNTELEIVPAASEFRYRNKMEFSFGDSYKGGPLNIGLRKAGNYYEVCNAKLCMICPEDFNKIAAAAKEYFIKSGAGFYHKISHSGELRHLTVRQGINTGEILVNIVTVSSYEKPLNELADILNALQLDGSITGILHTKNDSLADVVSGDYDIIYGRDYFYDMIGELKFKIYPYSFFQTNTLGAFKLYSTVKEFAGPKEDKIIFDLYCGTGTIAQILSENAEKVYGIEIVESAITAAKENAEYNGISNCVFISGDVLSEVPKLSVSPDIIILDPPREGIHPKAIGHIMDFRAKKIIYISCKPTSLIRDLKLFSDYGYKIDNIRIHDMFPKSYHVECVVLMSKVQD